MVKIVENLTQFKEGIYISEPLGKMITKGEKTLIVKKKKFNWENKLKYLVSGDKCYGIIMIKKIYPLPIDEFRKLEEKHKISELERSRWFPNVQILFAYEFDIIEKYKIPKKVELSKGIETDIKEVKFLLKYKTEKKEKLEEYAPVNPSDDNDKGRMVKWEEVTKYWKKPIKLVEGFIQLIGGVPSHKEGSTGDIDILMRKPEPKGSEDMPIKFRLFRSLPRELGNRLHFIYDNFHGPITDNVKVYDLVLMPIELKVQEMAEKPWARIWEVSKGLDKISKESLINRHDWIHACYKDGLGPKDDMVEIHSLIREEMKKRGINHEISSDGLDKKELTDDLKQELSKLRFVFQDHWGLKSVHGDIRFERDDHLVGWTLDYGKKGIAKEPILTMKDAKKMASNKNNWKINFETGETIKLPSGQPMKILAQEKKKQPIGWLTSEGIIPKGSPGATKTSPAVMLIRDKGFYEQGVEKPNYFEVFLHGSKLKGIYIFVKLPTKGLKPRDKEPFKIPMVWFWWRKKEQVPYQLSSRALETKTIPPVGISWLPKKTESLIPKEMRYWVPNITMDERLKRLEGAIDFWKGREIEMSHESDKVKFLKELKA